MARWSFAFLILHYQSIELTRRCVQSIVDTTPDQFDWQIVVVDNSSPNGSGSVLVAEYEDNPRVSVILNGSNEGFARGNNVGIRFIEDSFLVDFVVMLNNDVEILEGNFCRSIVSSFTKTGFAVFGPRIVGTDGSVDAYSFAPVATGSLPWQMVALGLKWWLCLLRQEDCVRRIEADNASRYRETPEGKDLMQLDVVLNGCCLVFSRTYLNEFSGIDDRTFLYKEEQLLHLRLSRSGLNSVYSPDTTVLHKEASTERLSGDDYLTRKRRFYRYQLHSTVVLLKARLLK